MEKDDFNIAKLKPFFRQLYEDLTKRGVPYILRSDCATYGINPRTMANLDCLGQGPRERFKVGPRTDAYTNLSFVFWLQERGEKAGSGNNLPIRVKAHRSGGVM
jgi:hypothetical protein